MCLVTQYEALKKTFVLDIDKRILGTLLLKRLEAKNNSGLVLSDLSRRFRFIGKLQPIPQLPFCTVPAIRSLIFPKLKNRGTKLCKDYT